MSWTRPTPLSGEAIPAAPKPPQDNSDIIPIRGVLPPVMPPVARTSAAAPRAKNVPVEARPWRVLFVPPTPGARTRTFNLSNFQRKALIGAAIALVMISVSAVTAAVVGFTSPDMFTPSAELASIRGRLAEVEDSLAAARVALRDADMLASANRLAAEPPSPARRRMLFGGSSVGSATSRSDGLPVLGTISSEFSNARRHPLLKIVRPHRGLDITAPRGTRVSAPAEGVVTFSGWKLAMGLTVEVQHADGVLTRYGHLRLAAAKKGEHVRKGSLLGTVGSSGMTTGPHLHYEILRFGRPVDPMRFHFPQPAAALLDAPVAPPMPGDGEVTPAQPATRR